LIGSLAGTPLAQTKGAEIERAQQEAAAQERQAISDQRADSASGIGETDGEDHETNQRDADGRRLWERQAAARRQQEPPSEPPRSKDASGQSGNLLDLSG
jgi:type II secretory pathway pseudopilin PulG